MALRIFGRLHDKIGTGGLVIAGLIVAALLFVLVSLSEDMRPAQVDTAAGKRFGCTVISVYDGDGPINCREVDADGKQVSIRLRGIEAREPDNSCQLDVCPPLSGAAAKAQLVKLAVGRIQCTSFGPSYNRIDASCFTPQGADISCELIRSGAAVRWAEYDREGRLTHCVPRRR